MIELLAALALAATTGWLLSNVGTRALDSCVSAFGMLTNGYQPDGWPRGVQEEYPERRWGASEPPPKPSPPPAGFERAARRVPTASLQARTRLR